jgi:hypothetical protein
MAKVVQETTNNTLHRKPHSLDTEQLEYSAKQIFTYGSLAAILLTLSVTYVYLLAQKIKN